MPALSSALRASASANGSWTPRIASSLRRLRSLTPILIALSRPEGLTSQERTPGMRQAAMKATTAQEGRA